MINIAHLLSLTPVLDEDGIETEVRTPLSLQIRLEVQRSFTSHFFE